MGELDKYEYNLKLEEIDKLVDQGDYAEAAKLADSIDWRRVRNIRTLCLISEIYEASGRLEDSKSILVRAYRRSPVGRTVLYRLIEVTTELQQYDEAIEYYTEYVQAAPHDNNRYILKYKIYKGRGSSIEELIAILEEYLGQEYTEKWAYELAKLYQQSGQMQKCLAACDDLVLWFHSGKYVAKALELKKRYATLTPKQQQIYEECLEEKIEEDRSAEEEEDNVIQKVESTDGEVIAESIMAETEKEIADQVTAHKAEMEKTPEEVPDIEKTRQYVKPGQEPQESEQEDTKNLQIQLAKSMRKIISGVVKHSDEAEEDIPASVDAGIARSQTPEIPEESEQIAGQLSIDDILLAMGDQGKKITDLVLGEKEEEAHESEAAAQDAQAETASGTDEEKPEEVPENAEMQETEESEEVPAFEERSVRSMVEAAADELTETQREALQYTSNPEKLLRNKGSLPTYMEAPKEPEDLGKTRRIGDSREELMEAVRQDIFSGKTRRIPTEEISRRMDEEQQGGAQELPQGADEQDGAQGLPQGADMEQPDGIQELPQDMDGDAGYEEGEPTEAEELSGTDDEEYDEEYLSIPQYLRGLFAGFTEVEGLEDQIANAILQTEAKGDDKTSRSGNILIFGAHGSGKTTLAMNLAKAIAQDKGSQTIKMARIYAADLNRKDIAATVAKIAGGTLIIEEAGDLEPNTVEQLTTAMEFRTDGLIVILEDEQQYIHEMLMRHPRFTMKFTAQIYLPEYTVEELAVFGRIYANAQDYVIGDEAYEVFCQKIAAGNPDGTPMTISGVIDIVGRAIARSGKFFRKISMGKKRYDENDFVILFPKDFK